MSKFGFSPSAELLELMQYGLRVKNSGEALAPIRNEIALQINEEILTALLNDLVAQLQNHDKSETALKLAQYVKASTAMLLKPLLADSPNQIAKTSIEFYGKSLFKAHDGLYRVGFDLDPRLYTNLQHSFAQLQAGERVNQAALAENYKQLAEAIVAHFITDFTKTLDLGMLKAKAVDLASTTVLKATYIALDKLIPSFNRNELKTLADYHATLFHP
jgi:hypothetical protein